MDETNASKSSVTQKKSKKKKSHWVYVKIGTRIVDVKKIAISADEDWDHITQKSQLLSLKEENRNREVWKWASGGKSTSEQQITRSTKNTSTKFVYKSEPKVVQQRGRTTNKLKSTLHPTLPKIVRSSPTPSPPARSIPRSKENTSLAKKNNISKVIHSPNRDNRRLLERNPNSLKLNPISDSDLHINKTKKTLKGTKVKSKKPETTIEKTHMLNKDKRNSLENKALNSKRSKENNDTIDEGFASDYSGAGNGSSIDNSSGDNTPLHEESKSDSYTSDKLEKRKVRSSSLPRSSLCSTSQFQRSSHIIRLTNSFKFETNNQQKTSPAGKSNEGEHSFTLEMTEVLDVNVTDEIGIPENENNVSEATGHVTTRDINLQIESEAKKLREKNILCALEEIRIEDKISIILQG